MTECLQLVIFGEKSPQSQNLLLLLLVFLFIGRATVVEDVGSVVGVVYISLYFLCWHFVPLVIFIVSFIGPTASTMKPQSPKYATVAEDVGPVTSVVYIYLYFLCWHFVPLVIFIVSFIGPTASTMKPQSPKYSPQHYPMHLPSILQMEPNTESENEQPALLRNQPTLRAHPNCSLSNSCIYSSTRQPVPQTLKKIIQLPSIVQTVHILAVLRGRGDMLENQQGKSQSLCQSS